ncbi:MAG: hypothetical protein NZ551_09675 [Microscillaceae bacterium]|nr:hypothetical protein [Microscillaceae bacterium]MDW8461467.1 hypothetical protein [Cytophagales bacterium]
MAITRLKRKNRRNAANADKRKAVLKFLTRKPAIKKIDIEAIKKEFAVRASQ